MRRNYQAWNIKLTDFPATGSFEEKIRFLLGYAVLAPSSHNSQPWSFEINENSVDILPNLNRKLTISDPEFRELYLSLGCCIENLLLTLKAFRVEYSGEYIFNSDNNLIVVYRIKILSDFFDIESAEKNKILNTIPKRHCNRGKHVFNEESKRLILEFTTQFEPSENCILEIVTDSRKKILGELSGQGTFLSMSNQNFRVELSQWVKNNYTKSGIGMPAFLMYVPTIISFVLPKILKKIKPSNKEVYKEKIFFSENTEAIGIIFVKNEDPISWIEAGRKFENFFLSACLKGLDISIHAASIETEVYKDIQKLFNTNLRPVIFFRLGICSLKQKSSPRLSAIECLKM